MTNEAQRLSLDEKLNLIKSRAHLLGFRRHDLEDAVQEVMLAVLEFEFEPEKSNGATESTALTTVIDRRLKSLKRASRRYSGLIERAGHHLAAEHQACDDGPCQLERTGEDRVLSGEVEAAIGEMDAEMQRVCRLLMEGLATKAIAEELRMGWHRANRLVTAIRERLEAAGFNPTDAE